MTTTAERVDAREPADPLAVHDAGAGPSPPPAKAGDDAVWAAPALALAPAAPGQTERFLPRVPLSAIVPSPLNPRKDAGDLEELTASIRAHGVLQPLVVRPNPPALEQARQGADVTHPAFSLVAGERRWRAAREAGVAGVPALVRYDLEDDATVQQLMLIENLQRRDLNAIEEAEGYRRLRELGMRQSEIAQAVGRAQPTVANALRLLDLPGDVRERIRTGALTAAHGRALASFKDFPTVASRLAEVAVADGLTVQRLERGALGEYGVQRALEQAGAAKVLEYGAPFDVAATCHACPFGAYRKAEGYGQGICLKPEHYRELAAAAGREQAARTKVAVEQAREHGQDLPSLRDLSWGTYERVDDPSRPPSGCSEACPCWGQALDHDGQAVTICTDPKRFRSLKAADTRAANAERDRRRAATLERLDARLDAITEAEQVTGREVAVLALLALQAAGRAAGGTERLLGTIRRHGGDWTPYLEAAKLADVTRWDGKAMRRALAALAAPDAATVVRVVVAAAVRDELETWEQYPELARWLGVLDPLDPTGEPDGPASTGGAAGTAAVEEGKP
jgi:ParB family chromosome partitioning protein